MHAQAHALFCKYWLLYLFAKTKNVPSFANSKISMHIYCKIMKAKYKYDGIMHCDNQDVKKF